jgi:hypothetical protein
MLDNTAALRGITRLAGLSGAPSFDAVNAYMACALAGGLFLPTSQRCFRR